jgi:hypothetical protein
MWHDRTAEGEAWTIPTRWLNAVIAVFLVPIAGVLTHSLFNCFHRAAFDHALWAEEEFWFFGLGAVLWTFAFFGAIWAFGEPRPLRVYVFGHELTHAIWVWAMGGRVSEFRVRRDGGYIITDTHNLFIALAPYFYPIYSMAVVVLYGVAAFFYELEPYTRLLFAALGFTWAFHLTFTLWMIPKGQSDLTHHGTFFSLVVIYLMNLLVLTVLLIIAAPQVTFASFAHQLLENAESLSAWVWEQAGNYWARIAS